MEKPSYSSKTLFLCFLLYEFTFYSQIAGRYPALAPFRLEFVIGASILLFILLKTMSGGLIFPETRITYGVIALITICFVSIPAAFVKRNALDTFIMLAKFSSVYFMAISCLDTEERIKVYYFFYLGLISLIFVEPFLLSLRGEGFRYANFMMRLYGVTGYFAHPNQLAGVVSANLPFFYFLIFYFRSLLMKALVISLMGIGIYVVMLTQSRTGFLGVVAFGFFAWATSRHKIKSLVICVVIATIAWHFAPEKTKERFLSLKDTTAIIRSDVENENIRQEYGSSASRWLLFKRSLIVFLENPILGVGCGCYTSYSGRKWNVWLETHNLYTQVLAELGIIGGFVFYYFLLQIFKCLRETSLIMKTYNDQSFLWFVLRALKMFFAIRLVIGLFGHDLYRDWWFFSAGLTVATCQIVKNKYCDKEAVINILPKQRYASG